MACGRVSINSFVKFIVPLQGQETPEVMTVDESDICHGTAGDKIYRNVPGKNVPMPLRFEDGVNVFGIQVEEDAKTLLEDNEDTDEEGYR